MLLAFSVAWIGIWVLAWFLFWRRRMQKWPLWVAFAPSILWVANLLLWIGLAATMLAGIIPGIIVTIAIGKLIVAGVGRGNVMARSRMQAAQPKAPPHGLVEGVSSESG